MEENENEAFTENWGIIQCEVYHYFSPFSQKKEEKGKDGFSFDKVEKVLDLGPNTKSWMSFLPFKDGVSCTKPPDLRLRMFRVVC